MSNFTPTTVKNKECLKLDTLQQRVACLADAGPDAIDDRLNELDREWTAGRVTKAVIGVLIVLGFGLTALLNPWWLILPAFGGVFLLQYLFTRSSWLGKMFHEMGYRTGFEVDQEKMALKVIRGDFRQLPTLLDIENQEDISRLEGEGGIVVEPEVSKVAPLEAAKVALEATMN
ncbi:MAG: hypothetical protein C0467_16525 [Planctomycetaceae bacterium]|nr:hypothetical protein [Planctomycetaceae bacterium]